MHDRDPWGRRDFLKTLPAGALSLCLPRAVAAAVPGRGDGRLPLAYAPTGAASGTATDRPIRAVDARGLAEGDVRFLARGARLRLLGVSPSEHLWEYTPWSALELDVVHDPERDIRHHAWCCENRHAPSVSASLSLRVPVSAEHGLVLAGALRDRGGARHPFELRLVTGHAPDAAKLRAGTYLAALCPGETVAWPRFHLGPPGEGTAAPRLFRSSLPAGEQAVATTLPVLAFSVETLS